MEATRRPATCGLTVPSLTEKSKSVAAESSKLPMTNCGKAPDGDKGCMSRVASTMATRSACKRRATKASTTCVSGSSQ